MEQQQMSEIEKNDYVCRRLNAVKDLVIQKNPTKEEEKNIYETIIKLLKDYPGFDFASFFAQLKDIYNQRGLEPRIERLKLLFLIGEKVNKE